MMTFIKILFILIAGIFIVTVLSDPKFLTGFSLVGPTVNLSVPADRSVYTPSYDTNGDGTISDTEYQSGEANRIQNEVTHLDREVQQATAEGKRSPYYGMVTLETGNTYATDRNEEYVTLYANYDNKAPIDITGWQLKSLISGRHATIPDGVRLLPTSQWFSGSDIMLAPGDRAYIETGGAAGIASSFLTNKCSGYLNQNNRLTPWLSYSCPLLKDEDLARFHLSFDDFKHEKDYDACMEAIDNVASCQKGIPDSSLTSACENFISDYGNYKGCVALHKNDADFYGNEWRIFLNAHQNDLWRNEREAIGLYDKQGLLIDIVRY